MNAFKLLSLLALMALASAQAAGDEPRMDTIIVTAKRPAVSEVDETVFVAPTLAPDSLAAQLLIEPPRLDYAEPQGTRPGLVLARAKPTDDSTG